MLTLNLLGTVQISAGGTGSLPLPRQAITLLAFLALHRGREHPRDELIERFWPQHDPERGRSALASALSRLRKALPAGLREIVGVSPIGSPAVGPDAPLSLDSERFVAMVEPALTAPAAGLPGAVHASLEQGLKLYRGDLLAGWYDDWVLPERERLRILYLRGLQRLMEAHAAVGEVEAALACGRAVLAQEPLHEAVCRRMMQVLAAHGERARALMLYREFEARLRKELGVAPDPATRTLRASLLVEPATR